MADSTKPESSKDTTASGNSRSLDDVMREPSTVVPDVVVLDVVEMEEKPKVFIDPKKDLWVSTVDGRHQSHIIPVRVGPHAETFYVHRDVLTRAEYFRRALDGEFREAEEQEVDLPEEDPGIFSFLVAFLYEKSFVPIKPVADALIDIEKGKGKECDDEDDTSSTESGTESTGSDGSARSRQRHEARQRRQQRAWEQRNRKEPGRHRPDCTCATCVVEVRGPPCWNCGMPRNRPPPPRQQRWYPNGMPMPPQPVVIGRNGLPIRQYDRHDRRGSRNRQPDEIVTEARMTPEDLRSWLMTYELSVDVYCCAERYLMNDFKSCVADFIVDKLETAGVDAAQPQVLLCCKTLHNGLGNNDALLKKVFARVGFMLARLWKNFPEETHSFCLENPDVSGLILKETMERREEDSDELPAMDRASSRSPVRDEIIIHERRGFR